MEEKERYELFGEFGIIHDTSPNAECMLLNKFQTCEILNKQDKENQQLKQQLVESEKSNEYFADRIEKADKEIKEIYKKYNELVEEYNNIKEEVDNNFVDGQKYNQLKQQLHDLPNKIVREIEEEIIKYDLLKNFPNEAGYCMLDSILDTILKKYGVENE